MAVPDDMYPAMVNSQDSQEPEIKAAHEGDAVLYMVLHRMCLDAYESRERIRVTLMIDKVGDAYKNYGVNMDEWASLMNVLDGKPEEAPITKAPPERTMLNPTQQTILQRRHGIT